MIHLDTSFLILGLVRDSRQSGLLRQWLEEGEPLGISAIGWAEFLCGPVGDSEARMAARFLGDPVAFGAEDAASSAALFNRSGRRRGSLVDCMIAAIALRDGAVLATANPTDFRRLEPEGLSLLVV
ncbi:MAG: PIN domain-containing protein [Acidobacteriota bacterium]|nr:PIN domain-containing protein [Acidobacteriota bacterium]